MRRPAVPQDEAMWGPPAPEGEAMWRPAAPVGEGMWGPAAPQDEAMWAPAVPEGEAMRSGAGPEGGPGAPEGEVVAERGGKSKRRRASFEVEALSERGLTERQQRILFAVGTVLVVLLGGFGLTAIVSTLGVSAPASEQGSAADSIGLPHPDEYQAWPSPKLFAPLADRKADATGLKAEEVFGTKTLKSGKLTLKLLGRRLDGACAQVMWGGEVLAKLATTGCTQAVRGLYLSADRRYVAQYTLFNLAGQADAERFVQEMATLYRGGGWIRPLESPSASFVTDGYTEASGHAMGHYAGFVWVGRLDGQEPGPKDDFVSLTLAVRGAEKAIFRRVVAVTGPETPPAK